MDLNNFPYTMVAINKVLVENNICVIRQIELNRIIFKCARTFKCTIGLKHLNSKKLQVNIWN